VLLLALALSLLAHGVLLAALQQRLGFFEQSARPPAMSLRVVELAGARPPATASAASMNDDEAARARTGDTRGREQSSPPDQGARPGGADNRADAGVLAVTTPVKAQGQLAEPPASAASTTQAKTEPTPSSQAPASGKPRSGAPSTDAANSAAPPERPEPGPTPAATKTHMTAARGSVSEQQTPAAETRSAESGADSARPSTPRRTVAAAERRAVALPKPKPSPAPDQERRLALQPEPAPAPERPARAGAPNAEVAGNRRAQGARSKLSGLAALDAEIAESRRRQARNEQMKPPGPAPRSADPHKAMRGLAALDAEIAAARSDGNTAGQTADAAAPAPSRGETLTGLAALDAEIAASRGATAAGHRHRDASTKRAADTQAEPGAPPAGDPAARGRAERRYLAALRRALERQQHYPASARRRRLEGTARVQFTIAANGSFSGVQVSQSAGAEALDAAATGTVERLARFDPIPAAIGRDRWTVRVPIVFRLN
jgi:protein TonB